MFCAYLYIYIVILQVRFSGHVYNMSLSFLHLFQVHKCCAQTQYVGCSLQEVISPGQKW
jgi:hypothetical protein